MTAHATRASAASWLLLSGVWLAAACDGGGAASTAELRGYSVTVPPGWTATREGHGPKQELVLTPREPTVVCRLVVVRDGRRFGPTDVSAFLQSGRDAFGGRRAEERPARIETASGALDGIVISGAEVPSSFAVRALAGDLTLDLVAAARDIDLVAGLVGRYSGDTNGDRLTGQCRDALASLR